VASAIKAIPEPDSVTGEIATAVKHSFIYGFGGVLVKGLGFFLLPVYTHFLTPRDYGVFEVLELCISLLSMFLNMGVTAALLKYYGAAQTDEEKHKIVGSIFLLTVATSTVVLLAGSASVRQATLLLLGPGVPPTYLFLALVAFLLAYVANVPYTAIRAREASKTIVTIDTLTTIGVFLLNIYFIAVARLAILGLLLSKLIVNAISIVGLVKWTSREVFGGMNWNLVRRVMSFGAPLVFSNLTMFTLNFSDRFFLQRLQTLEVVGIYAVGYKFGFLLNFLLIQPFNMMWQARMYIVHRRSDHQKVFSRIFVFYSAVLIFACLGMAVMGPALMKLMVDSRYAAAGAVIPVVSLSYVFLGMAYYLQLGMFLMSRTGLIGVVSMVAAALNLAANYFLILHFGMIGAAWATVLGFLAIAAGSYYCSERVCPLRLPIGRVLRAGAVAAVIYAPTQLLPPSSLATALLLKGILVASFPVLLWVSGCFSTDERATLQSLRTGAVRMLRPAWLRI
jgi:O-antigen/teichoic acid export membrane protein